LLFGPRAGRIEDDRVISFDLQRVERAREKVARRHRALPQAFDAPGESPFFIADGNGLILSCIAPDAAPGLHVTEAASLRVAVLAKKAGAILMRRRAVLTNHRCGTFWKPLTCSKGLS